MFFVRSLEPFYCPSCQSGTYCVIGSRNRVVIQSSDIKKIYRIRRLQCLECERIHHELPGCVIPYKRHCAQSIEAALEEREVAVEESTLRRWKAWFDSISGHLMGVLMDRQMGKTPDPGTALQRFRKVVGNAPGWLGRVVQSVVKQNLWVQTRSAFCAG